MRAIPDEKNEDLLFAGLGMFVILYNCTNCCNLEPAAICQPVQGFLGKLLN